MPVNSVAENVLGTIGTICWTAQLVPQVWKSYRSKSTEGLSPWMVLLWSISAVFLGVYVIVQDLNIPLIIQPQLFGALCLASWSQCQCYGNKQSFKACIIMFLGMATFLGGFETAMIFAVKPSYEHGNDRPTMFFGIAASVLLTIGFIPQYHEIWKHCEVIGLSITFMAIDFFGGVFSNLSLVFKPEFDVVAGVAYSLIIVLDLVVILAALILNPRARRQRRREALLSDAETGDSRDLADGHQTTTAPSEAETAVVVHGTGQPDEPKPVAGGDLHEKRAGDGG
ncbi:hypothetical protein JAAARDRAFT_506400 [Jaapia argillacea MUCL 33604]|uniref:PQ-loop-domain-containing protein n=1 Tax=Jaapia argillacea MUCL 33604 TaxID=933084 RepID=A0A067QFF4_9AGAM|nr:hypothetical protein JAAARDRAFT_506400 [Jaapia argillacea MUCL 33604]